MIPLSNATAAREFLLRVVDDLIQAKQLRDPSPQLLHEMLGRMHCEQGEALLIAWNIPDPDRSIVRHHHDANFSEEDMLLLVVRLADHACNRLGMGISPMSELVLASTAEAQVLRVPEMMLAELEVALEDSASLAP